MKQISMKKLLIAAGIGLGMGLTAHAQGAPEGYLEVENYLESFSSTSVASERFNGPTDPLGWDKLIGDVVNGTSTYKISYTTLSSGKVGYAVGTSSTWKRTNWSTNTESEIYDYIITPLVKGDLKFWLKRHSTSSSYPMGFELYKMTKNADGTFSCNPETDRLLEYTQEDLEAEMPNTSTWTEHTYTVGDEYAYIGIRMQCIYIDEVSADAAIVPVKKDITLGNAVYSDGYSYKINATPEGTWKVGVEIPVTNNSNVPLMASEEGENYTISFVRVINTNPYNWTALETVTLPDLAVGETKTIKVEGEYPIPEDVKLDATYGYYRFRLDFVENYTGKGLNKSLSSWAEITPYQSMLEIRYDKKSNYNGSLTDTQVDPTKPIQYGTYVGEREVSFRLKNRGPAPLTFESIEKPEWVTISNMPEVIEPDSDPVTIGVKIGGEPGIKSGKIKFNTNGAPMVDEIAIWADVVADDVFFSDFEGDAGMDAWFVPNPAEKWELGAYTSDERTATENYTYVEYGVNDKRMQHGSRLENPEDLYSPKMAFKDGDQISFYAAKRTNSGADVKLKVSYSPDRVNWTELGTIKVTNDENSDLQFSSGTSTSTTSNGQNIMKRFAFAMPEGEYYINLAGSYVLVDNFVGGKLVDMDYDIAPISAEAGKTRMVNNALDFSATFRNLLSEAVPADDQVVCLYADGEVVATATGKEIAAFSNVTYDLSYVPHKAGETELYAEIAIGDYVAKSAVVSLTIQNESASVKNQIGETTTTDSMSPLYLNYNNSKSEFIYTAEDLAEVEGATILKISYPYYKTSDEHAADKVTIWMEVTDETEIGDTFSATDNMTKVMEVSNYQYPKIGSSNDLVEMEFTLDTPFDFDKTKNLRVIIESLAPNCKQAYFGVDKSNTSRKSGRRYMNDGASTFENNKYGAGTLVTGLIPVINLYTSIEVAEATGTVTSTEGGAVVGATVRATAVATEENPDVDVYYETTTDEAGEWSMQIFQSEYEYTLTVRALGYESYEGEEGAMSLTEPNNVELVKILLGDANDNGDVTVADVVTIANYLVGITNENSWSTTKADINGDGKVSIDDLQAVVNIILGISDDSKRNSNAMTVNDKLIADDFRVTGSEQFEIPVRLVNTKDYTQLQADIIIPDGMVIEKVTKGERASSHTIISNEVDGVLKLVIYNFGTTPFADIDGALFNLVVTADEECGNIRMENIFVSDARANAYELNYEGGANLTGTTGVDGIEADRNGVRYFTVDGIEVFNPEKGRILIRVEGGKAKKVVL